MHSSPAPELLTDRLLLRGWREDDVPALAAIYAQPDVVRYLRPLDLDATAEQVLTFIHHWDQRGFGIWAVELRERPGCIGRIGLIYHDDWVASPHDAEVGWALDRRLWGRGLATEGGGAALRFAFESHAMRQVISIAHRDNHGSQRVMDKLGMLFTGQTEWRSNPVVWHTLSVDQWRTARPSDRGR